MYTFGILSMNSISTPSRMTGNDLFHSHEHYMNRRRQRFFPLSGGLRFLSHSPHSVASDTTYVFQQEPILGRFKLRR